VAGAGDRLGRSMLGAHRRVRSRRHAVSAAHGPSAGGLLGRRWSRPRRPAGSRAAREATARGSQARGDDSAARARARPGPTTRGRERVAERPVRVDRPRPRRPLATVPPLARRDGRGRGGGGDGGAVVRVPERRCAGEALLAEPRRTIGARGCRPHAYGSTARHAIGGAAGSSRASEARCLHRDESSSIGAFIRAGPVAPARASGGNSVHGPPAPFAQVSDRTSADA
jgi:hypothetical protein